MTQNLEPGVVVGDLYRLEEPLAEQVHSTLYRATKVEDGSTMTVGVLREEYAKQRGFASRFLRGARVSQRIRHEAVAKVVDFGTDSEGHVFHVMEQLHGKSLASRVSAGSLPDMEAFSFLIPVAEALAIAHGNNIIHRGICPNNIFICRELGPHGTRVLGFGGAKDLSEEGVQTAPGMVLVEAPWYQSPEQILGESPPGIETDVWSLGVTLFECLTGEMPHLARSMKAAFAVIAARAPRPIRTVRPDLDSRMAQTIDRMLSLDASSRPTMREVTLELQGALSRVALKVKRGPVATQVVGNMVDMMEYGGLGLYELEREAAASGIAASRVHERVDLLFRTGATPGTVSTPARDVASRGFEAEEEERHQERAPLVEGSRFSWAWALLFFLVGSFLSWLLFAIASR